MIRSSREANVFLKFHRDILSETNSNLQNDPKWNLMTFLIITLSCHYFENGIKQVLYMYDQYFLAASTSDQCCPLELTLCSSSPFKDFSLADVAGRGWMFKQLLTFKNITERRCKLSAVSHNVAGLLWGCSLQQIVVFQVASAHLLEFKHFTCFNVRVGHFAELNCSKGFNPSIALTWVLILTQVLGAPVSNNVAVSAAALTEAAEKDSRLKCFCPWVAMKYYALDPCALPHSQQW